MAYKPYHGEIMKMTMHIDEDVLAEVMKATGAKSKTKAVAAALNEMARKAKLKAILKEGLGLSSAELKNLFDPASVATMALAEDKVTYGHEHKHTR
jgi:Arc/MetJ family transcription regulator